MKKSKIIAEQIKKISDTPRLDAELLVAEVLGQSRSWLITHGDQVLSSEQETQLQKMLARRLEGEPMAYILGHKEFWSLELKVNPHVLVPRPETEHLVEWVLDQFTADQPLHLADLGTGSGAIALAIASERSQWQVDATDFSVEALKLAKLNAAAHHLKNVDFYQGVWCQALPQKNYDVILSNPPYIAEDDSHLEDLKFEPRGVIVAGKDGLSEIRQIIQQAPEYLAPNGYLVLEHGFNQATEIMSLLKNQGFTDIQSHNDLANLPRFITAKYCHPAT